MASTAMERDPKESQLYPYLSLKLLASKTSRKQMLIV